ncbi:putative E3 ubiquitin-protein ligase LUL3 [Vitis vinifera]|uniref:Putative E3 ubiquitin-protein ligase LUL3 n=1 Tax=Vitis vinifera TaxID=29760 RepID=A0A438KC44_VITVI|nr:putative E3 ubiquitin-protein ligase LUL3 [Vitis vinifera]
MEFAMSYVSSMALKILMKGGIGNNDTGKECVICMTEPNDTGCSTLVVMWLTLYIFNEELRNNADLCCLCSECAKQLRLQSNKCPVCRHPIQELIVIVHKGNN